MNAFGELTGQNALITGASSGIGRAIARVFASAGANVIVHAARSEEAANQLARELRQMGVRSEVLMTEFATDTDYTAFVEQAWQVFGSLDCCVNNAGVDLLTTPAAEDDYATKLQALWTVDVAATVLISKLVGQKMASANGGNIINVGWDQADRGMGGDSGELFAASKNAIMGNTRSLAVSLAPKVRVNCIAPGWIRTKWGDQASEYWQNRVIAETPLARWGEPTDIAKLARFLASSDAAFITGQVMNVNGGAVR